MAIISVRSFVYETMINTDQILEIRKITHDKYRIELIRGSVEVSHQEYERIMDRLNISAEERI